MANFFESLFSHWRTSLAGGGLFVVELVRVLALNHPVSTNEWLVAVGLALTGAFAKDGASSSKED